MCMISHVKVKELLSLLPMRKRQDNLLISLMLITYVMLCNTCFIVSVWLHGFISFLCMKF